MNGEKQLFKANHAADIAQVHHLLHNGESAWRYGIPRDREASGSPRCVSGVTHGKAFTGGYSQVRHDRS